MGDQLSRPISMRLRSEVLSECQQFAVSEQRSLSSMINILLAEAINHRSLKNE